MTMAAAIQPLESSPPNAWTIGRILSWSTDYLSEKGVDAATPRLDAEILLSDMLGLKRIDLYLQFDRPLSSDERNSFKESLRRRQQGEPVAYIVGHKDFMGRTFRVNPAVLIPRPDTETLVEMALTRLQKYSSARILDIGTGSGCIAITLATELSDAQVEAWDISTAALATATKNAEYLGVANVSWRHCDAQQENTWASRESLLDLIVANPPYISAAEMTELAVNVRGFEPHLALHGGTDGLEFYRLLSDKCGGLLRSGGALMLEIGASQAPDVTGLLQEKGWVNIQVAKDLAGKDRVVVAEKP